MLWKSKKVFYCNVKLVINVIGGKWKQLIIYHLVNKKKVRFGEFKRSILSTSVRERAITLRELEMAEFVHRVDF